MPKPTLVEQPTTTLRCTAKLLKRLRLPAELPEPPPAETPLGEWYADIDFIDREPFVLLLGAATGAGLVLPGRADSLRHLHMNAGQQFFSCCCNSISIRTRTRARARSLAPGSDRRFIPTRAIEACWAR